jgi:protein O-mannosyl-transferase
MAKSRNTRREHRGQRPADSAPAWPRPARHRWWQPFLLIVIAIAAFSNSFVVPFVMDDRSSIVDNPNIRQLSPLTQALSGPPQSAIAGRPVVSLSLAINYALGGLSPVSYHAFNLGVHILAGLVLFGILRRTFGRLRSSFDAPETGGEEFAFVCCLLWLVHPLQTEMIDYITQRTESMMGLFYLLTLYAAIRAMTSDTRARRWYAIAIASCLAGMGTKESMATAPVMVLLYDSVFVAGSIGRALRERAWFYAGLAATWILLVALIASGPRSHSAGFSSGLSPWMYLLNQPAIIVRYLRLAFWPSGLVLDYGVPHAVAPTAALPYAAIVGVLLAGVAALWRVNRALAYAGTWFFVTLAPTSSIVPIATEVGAERRMYLPLAAVVVLVVVGARSLGGSSWSSFFMTSRARTAATTVVIGVLVALTLQRNAEYYDEVGLWQTVLDRRPHGRAHYNLGVVLAEQGRRAEAIAQYAQAVADDPAAHYALGFELDGDGKTREAIEHLRAYVRALPDDINSIRAYILLGRALARDGQTEDAMLAYREALRRQPLNADARGGLADALLARERFDEAIGEYEEYLRAMPGSATAHYNLGLALVAKNREADAARAFARAVEIQPGDVRMRQNLAIALASTGRLDAAAEQYRRALALAPNDATLHDDLGSLLASQGKLPEAIDHFRAAVRLQPDNEDARRKLEAAVNASRK